MRVREAVDTGPGQTPAGTGMGREEQGECGHIFPKAEQLQAAQGTQERRCEGRTLLCSSGGSSQELGTAGARWGGQPA